MTIETRKKLEQALALVREIEQEAAAYGERHARKGSNSQVVLACGVELGSIIAARKALEAV